MGLQGAVTRFATDRHFGHGSMVLVRLWIIILSQSCVVTSRTHAVPVHTSPGPMPPFASLPAFFSINVEPLMVMRIIGGVHRLQAAIPYVGEVLPQWCVPYHPLQAMHLIRTTHPKCFNDMGIRLLLGRGFDGGNFKSLVGIECFHIEFCHQRTLGHAMVGWLPLLKFRCMTLLTTGRTCVLLVYFLILYQKTVH